MIGLRWAGFALLTVVGCGPSESPKLAVRGRVTYQGYPVRGGVLVFIPDAERGHRGELARAAIDQDGGYRIAAEAGLTRGPYRVTIASLITPLPPRFCDPERSGLVRVLVPGAENVIDFHLTGP